MLNNDFTKRIKEENRGIDEKMKRGRLKSQKERKYKKRWRVEWNKSRSINPS